MTYEELYAVYCFRMEICIDDVLVASRDVMYHPAETCINYQPATITYTDEQGRSISFTVECVEFSYEEGVPHSRQCTVTTSERASVCFRTSLNQVSTRVWVSTAYDYGIVIDDRNIRHVEIADGSPVVYEAQRALQTLFSTVQVANLNGFGGQIRVNIHFPTNLILRDPENNNLIMRSPTSGKILRDY